MIHYGDFPQDPCDAARESRVARDMEAEPDPAKPVLCFDSSRNPQFYYENAPVHSLPESCR